jgi:hypothetical protein
VTTTTTLDDRARRYLDEVRGHLADQTDDERDELVEDLARHLHELSATDDRPLEEVLGPPAAFAAELRASAGIPPEAPTAFTDGSGSLRSLVDTVAAHPWTEATEAFLVELRPAWWIARGLLVALGLGLVLGIETGPAVIPLLVAGAVVSVRSGRRGRTSHLARLAGWAVAAVAVVAFLALTSSGDPVDSVDQDDSTQFFPTESGIVHADGRQITNIYAYDRDGTPIDDVLLYDQDGEPLDAGSDLYDLEGYPLDTNFPVDGAGVEVRNAYPLDQRAVTGDADGRERGVAVRRPSVVVPPEPDPDPEPEG